MEIISQAKIDSNWGMENNKPDKIAQGAEKSAQSFQQVFNETINNVQNLQNQSNNFAKALATGEISDIHQVTIAAEKASLSLDFVIQARNKIVDAYQEIMRMQV